MLLRTFTPMRFLVVFPALLRGAKKTLEFGLELGEKNNAGVIKTVPNQHYLSIQQYTGTGDFMKKFPSAICEH